MKNVFCFITLFLTVITASAYDFKVDNICYQITSLQNKTCSVCGETNESGYIGEVNIPNYVSFEGIEFKVTTIGYCAFENDYLLTSVIIPENITKVEEGAFGYCTGLKSITILDSDNPLELSYNNMTYDLYKDGESLFYRCSLEDIYIGRPLTFLTDRRYGYSPFYKSKVQKVTFSNNVKEIPSRLFYYCSQLNEVVLSNSIKKINNYAFFECTSLQNITFNEGLETLGSSVFYNSKLQNLVIPASVTNLNGTFRKCSFLTNVQFVNDEIELGDYTFAECSSLTSFTIPKNMTIIPQSLLEGCSSLTSIELPYGVEKINSSAFSSCSSLKSVSFPNTLKYIGSYVFGGCSELEAIELPNSLEYIGFHSFLPCEKLRCVKCLALTPPEADKQAYENHPFDNMTYLVGKLYVPDASIELYKTSTPWDNFTNILTLSEYEAGINDIVNDYSIHPVYYISVSGVKGATPFSGLNIVVNSDGSTQKITF